MTDLFFGTSGPRDARVAIVGESWGSNEAQLQKPFVGESGKELDKMLAEAGLARDQCFLTNVVAKQPQYNDMFRLFVKTKEAKEFGNPNVRGLYPTQFVLDELLRLYEQLTRVQPEVIIGFGNYSLWALTENCFSIGNSPSPNSGWKIPTGITSWRGSQLYWNEIPFVPTYHPAAILRQWAWRNAAVHDLRVRVQPVLNGGWQEPKVNAIIRPSFEVAMKYLTSLYEKIEQEPTEVSVDTETYKWHMSCIGFAYTLDEAICIPLMCDDRKTGYWDVEEEFQITKLIRKILVHKNCLVIGQNFNYDLQYLTHEWHIAPEIHFDTMIAQHVCWPGTPKGLDYISSLYCKFHRYWKDEGKHRNPNISDDEHWLYNCKDVIATLEAARVLKSVLAQLGLEDQMQEQLRFGRLAFMMMLRGVAIKSYTRTKSAFELMEAISEREDWLDGILSETTAPKKKGAKPWYRSPKQLQTILYEHLGQKVIRDSKTKRPTANDEALNLIAEREPILRPILIKVQELRSLGVFFSTFITAPLDPDGRMRCEFKVTGTETFRWSSAKNAFGRGANLQTIPKGTEDE